MYAVEGGFGMLYCLQIFTFAFEYIIYLCIYAKGVSCLYNMSRVKAASKLIQ